MFGFTHSQYYTPVSRCSQTSSFFPFTKLVFGYFTYYRLHPNNLPSWHVLSPLEGVGSTICCAGKVVDKLSWHHTLVLSILRVLPLFFRRISFTCSLLVRQGVSYLCAHQSGTLLSTSSVVQDSQRGPGDGKVEPGLGSEVGGQSCHPTSKLFIMIFLPERYSLDVVSSIPQYDKTYLSPVKTPNTTQDLRSYSWSIETLC